MRYVKIAVTIVVLSSASRAMALTSATVQVNGIECVPVWGPTASLTYSENGITNVSSEEYIDVFCPLTRAAADSDTSLGFKPTFTGIWIYPKGASYIGCSLVSSNGSDMSPQYDSNTFSVDTSSFSGTRMKMDSNSFIPIYGSYSENLYCTLGPSQGILGVVTVQTAPDNSQGAAVSPVTPFPMF